MTTNDMHDTVETTAGDDSPIHGFLDAPDVNATAPGTILLWGWACSSTAAIVRVDVFLDNRLLGTAHYGDDRHDVIAAFSSVAPLECGYRAHFDLAATTAGSALLSVRVIDGSGARRDFERRVTVTQPIMRMHLHSPRPGESCAGGLTVSGWAFGLVAPIASVEVFLGDQALGALKYGLPRPDLHASFKHPHSSHCGFWGTLAYNAQQVGEENLIVRATDLFGNRTDASVTIRLTTTDEPVAEIERAFWRGGMLDVEGWAISTRSISPMTAHLYLDDRYVGRACVNLTRPDIGRQYPQTVGAHRSGFRFKRPFMSPETVEGKKCELSVEFVDRQGHCVQRHTQVVNEAGSLLAGAAHAQFAAVIAEYRRRMGRDPALLDWHTGLGLADAFPQHTVFQPPTVDTATLPYIDGSIDVVVVATDDREAREEARRVAAAIVIVAGERELEPPPPGSAARTTRSITVVPEWRGEALDQPSPLPTWSIVIPVRNSAAHVRACLAQLSATLPDDFAGEIIVVDDGSTDDTPLLLDRACSLDGRMHALRNAENEGSIASCNRGAVAASGDIVIFLDIDTLPQPGWLLPLLTLFRTHPDAGAAGSKLVDSNGTLEGAGGMLFSDGSRYQLGCGDAEVEAPLYNYVRAVDYCSSAALATRRDLFLSLGGFDARFALARYGDADYCFRLRAHGRRVYYQPESIVARQEAPASDTHPTRDGERYQAANWREFVDKWRDSLQEQPPPPRRYGAKMRHALSAHGDRGHTGAKRALVCAPLMPEFDRESGSRRVFHLIGFLREAGWAVSFLGVNANDGGRYARALQQMGVATYAGEESSWAGEEYLGNPSQLIADGDFDLALFIFWGVMERYLPSVRSLSPRTRVVVDSVDLHLLRLTRGTLGTPRPDRPPPGLTGAHADEMIRELNAYAAADAVLTVSHKEADFIGDLLATPDRVFAIPDAEEIAPSPVPLAERRGLLFLANFRHPPNVEAIEFLCRAIVPRIDPALLAAHPISVVGNGLTEDICALADGHPHIRMVGWVPSVLPYLARARLSLVPLLHGAGTKRKLIEALMIGTPSVSTAIGAEGLRLEHDVHVLVADDPAAFAAAIARLVADDALWRRLAARGRARIMEQHGRASVQGRFLSAIAAVLDRPTDGATAAGEGGARADA